MINNFDLISECDSLTKSCGKCYIFERYLDNDVHIRTLVEGKKASGNLNEKSLWNIYGMKMNVHIQIGRKVSPRKYFSF